VQLDGSRDLAAVLEAIVAQVLAGDLDLCLEGRPLHDPGAVREAFAGEIGPTVHGLAAFALLAG
jgi:hypothetical protein